MIKVGAAKNINRYAMGGRDNRYLYQAFPSQVPEQGGHGTPQETFSVLTNVDLDFGSVDTPAGPRPLTQSTFSSLMQNRDRFFPKPVATEVAPQRWQVGTGHFRLSMPLPRMGMPWQILMTQ